jgi:type VI secretion system secreted protein Hcp
VVTISGQTFTIGGGKTLTINGTPGVAPLRPNAGGRPVAELGLDLGGSQQSLAVLSWSFGASQGGAQASGGGGGAGKANVHEIQVTKTVDKASPLLFKACASGQHIPKVTLTLRKAGKGQQEYLKITMKDVLISSYQQSNSGGERPVESLSLNFTKVEYQYTPQK